MGFIKEYLNKIACHHEWEVHSKSSVYEYSFSQRPYKIEETLICKKCGKIKKDTTMKTLTNKQKEYFDFIKEWSPNKFNGNPNNYKDVCDYITHNKEVAHSNYYLSTGGNSAYL